MTFAGTMLAGGASAATFVVNDANDATPAANDAAAGDGFCRTAGLTCTLRAAIQEANALAGADTINFNIAPAGLKTITLSGALPSITGPVTINGTTQPGFVAAPPYTPVIEISAALGGAAVLDLRGSSDNSTIRGLTINRCPFVAIRIAGSSNNVVAGNFLGTNPAGTAAGPGNQVGVYIGLSNFVTSSNNRVGGTVAADRNLISGNTSDGIQVNAGTAGVTNNTIAGNYIGVDVNGSNPIPNTNQGVAIFGANAQTNTTVGGTAAGAGNLISGNGNDGILIANATTTGTRVEGNRIGTNAAGTAAIANARGVEITVSAAGNTVGGTVATARNVISGNGIGVLINGASSNSVLRNFIGTDITGATAVPNSQHGVQIIAGSSNNLIGDALGNGNVISGNTLNGVDILQSGTSGNRVSGNTIGLDVGGTLDVGNLQFGVAIAQGASGNVVGEAGGRNVISYNKAAGVRIVDIGTNNNVVQLNYIGLDVTGTLPKPNSAQGVILDSGAGAASGNTIGGTGAGNVISGNGGAGVVVRQLLTATTITGNRIGTNAAGTAGVPNGSHGVQLAAGTTANVVGSIAAPNLISANVGQGVRIDGAGTTGNVVVANLIGTNAAGTGALGNTNGGVAITNNAASNTIGGTAGGAGNRIAFNSTYGINVATGAGTGNAILGNAIFGNVSELGIDLLHEPGVTANDLGDVDGGANNVQNFPVLSAAMTNELGQANFAGSLNGAASTLYRIEFFANSIAVGPDGSGFGEGERYLGFSNVTTNASGNAVIGVTLAVPSLSAGETVTATATDPSNNTSEFSAAVLAYKAAIVTTTADVVDGDTSSVVNLIATPGPDGRVSLREAITATNNAAGLDTVRFGIPLTDANHLYYRDNAAASLTNVQPTALADVVSPSSPAISDFDPDYPAGLTRSWYRITPTSALPLIGGPLALDATTQPGALTGGPVIEVVGTSAGAAARGFATGAPATPSTFKGLIVNQFAREGITSPAPTTTIQGCYIGTDPSGTLARGNATSGTGAGVYLGGNGSQLGGLTVAERNVISANQRNGVWIDASNVTLQGNYVGTDVTGSANLGNGVDGVVLEPTVSPSVTAVAVGGSAAGSPNRIAYNAANGIRASGAVSGGSFVRNSIHSNGGLGIDLAGNGPTLNDAGDPDLGPNELINFPSLPPAVETTPGTLSVSYGLDLAMGFYRIEFFKNPSGSDPSHFGEGESFVSALVVNHPGGSVVYGTSLAGSVGDVISATTTVCSDGAPCTAFGSTSEFSTAWPAVTTAVKLLSFDATAGDESVRLAWKTASELDNLGFHLYRAPAADGPWTRITPSLIPGLGSSPIGAAYSWLDGGLANGTRYYYRLEDVDTRSLATSHGPVSAVPSAAADEAAPDPAADGAGRVESYGDPGQLSLRVLSRTARRAVVELRTGGFYVQRDAAGRVRVSIPGFELPDSPLAAALPLRRALLEAEVGRGARLGAIVADDDIVFPRLAPAAVGYPEIRVGDDGTVRPTRRAARLRRRADARGQDDRARLVGAAFLGEAKRVVLELHPLDETRGGLRLWRRLRVEVVFDGLEATERGAGGRGRRRPKEPASAGETLAYLHTSSEGLQAVRFESLRLASRSVKVSQLALLRQGEPVPFHVEPRRTSFGPGGVLYFLADRAAASTAFTGEVAYELVQAGGTPMATASALPAGAPVRAASWGTRRFEENRIYQAGLLDAVDPWLWTAIPGGSRREMSFALEGLAPAAAGRLALELQGGSDGEGIDHHLAVLVNGVPVGELRFDGKAPHHVELDLPAGVLSEGANTLSLDNRGDTGVYSLVFLDRFEVGFQQSPALDNGRFAGSWSESGVATVAGAAAAVALDVSDPRAPVWLSASAVGDSLQLRVEAGHRYLVAAPAGLATPRVAPPVRTDLRDASNQADYLVVAPASLLPATAPLVERRRGQGLSARAVTLEEIAASFGHGEASAEAIHGFLRFAFQEWAQPSPRYVLLLGDASYDPRNFTGSAQPAPLPALWTRTTYLWTASDPGLAAVNGDDAFPDLALGRLPAKTLEQAQALVAKLLDWEDSGQGLGGAAVLVADNPDPAGDFEQDVDDIQASFLADRPVTTIKLRELGSATRPAILEALDRGASLVSYVGHGGSAVWASENVLNSWDVGALAAQSRQPLMLTMNCLNGYFVAPGFDSLAEAFLAAPGRGTIAAFSPSGLSLDAPAHVLHRAVMAEITSGRHLRLGDAVLAAQQAYAETGLMPELLSVYHLFGDPALALR